MATIEAGDDGRAGRRDGRIQVPATAEYLAWARSLADRLNMSAAGVTREALRRLAESIGHPPPPR